MMHTKTCFSCKDKVKMPLEDFFGEAIKEGQAKHKGVPFESNDKWSTVTIRMSSIDYNGVMYNSPITKDICPKCKNIKEIIE